MTFPKWSESPYETSGGGKQERIDISTHQTYNSLPIIVTNNNTDNFLLASDSNFKSDASSTLQSSLSPTEKPKLILQKVTLPNHSPETSVFSRVYSKPANNPYGYYDRQYKNGLDINRKRYKQETALNAEDENLLLSDRTHFRPIKQTFVDGYTFDIPYHLEDIKYQRSESGSLYYESEKYMEYKLFDRSSRWAPRHDQFIMKFCVKQNDKACQTEDNEFYYNIDDDEDIGEERILNNFGNEGDVASSELCSGGRENIIDDIESEMEYELRHEQTQNLNYCNCYEKKYDDKVDDDLNLNENDIDMLQYYHNKTDNVNKLKAVCPVHPLANSDIDKWSMNNIKANCMNIQHIHTLWGHCNTCNNDTKSQPANRRMRDELSAEGDEIMLNLKYMRDLIIGTSWENESQIAKDNLKDKEDNDLEDDEEGNIADHCNSHIVQTEDCEVVDYDFIDEEDVEPSESTGINVNKLISDLLKPETAKSITEVLGPCQSEKLLEKIELSNRYQQTRDWYNIILESPALPSEHIRPHHPIHRHNPMQLNTENSNEFNEDCRRNISNGYLSTDRMFNIWQKHNDSDMDDWSNSKDLKAVIESNDATLNDNDVDDKCETGKQFEIIGSWNDGEIIITEKDNFNDDKIDYELNSPLYIDIHHDKSRLNRQTNFNNTSTLFTEKKGSFYNDNNNDSTMNNNNNYNNNNIILSDYKKSKNRGDRKRRHSASQNLNHDLFKMRPTLNYDADCDEDDDDDDYEFHDDSSEKIDVRATIIACKYWAKYGTINISNRFKEDFDGPSSILNHVTMVSRPLTR